VTALLDHLREHARTVRDEYSHGEHRPLGGYVGTLAVYTAGAGLSALAYRLAGRQLPDRLRPGDLALAAVATGKVARLLAKDPVTSPIRAPFTRYEGQSGPAELAEEVRGVGARKTLGELLTCPFCSGQWVATGFVAGLLVAPRPTRVLAGLFAVAAGGDLYQHLYALIEQLSENPPGKGDN
jgi:Protein of unknown function (DUF1360)